MNNCSKHKRKPQHRPSADCLDCWLDYMADNPDAIITAKDLRRVLDKAMNIQLVVKITWNNYRDYLERGIGKGGYNAKSNSEKVV